MSRHVKYAYEDLSPSQFEDLVVLFCFKLLGIGTQKFSTGPDQGRDAKFVGRAERFPSSAEPWEGITIIQAKHTEGYNERFSDSDFYGSKTSTITAELPRIKQLRKQGQLDNYILFANRRLGSVAETTITSHIATESGLPPKSISLCGIERMELWLKAFPDIAQIADLDPLDSPLLVSPDDLASVVEAFAGQREILLQGVTADDFPVPRITYAEKNRINNMSADFGQRLRQLYLKDTPPIKAFLADPVNVQYRRLYEGVAEEFQLNVAAHRKEYQEFDRVFNRLGHLLFARDPLLRGNKRLTRTVLFYMYWNCDLGWDDHATA